MEHNIAHQVINSLSPTLQTSREVLPASFALPTLETAELMQENCAVSRHIWELLEMTQKKNKKNPSAFPLDVEMRRLAFKLPNTSRRLTAALLFPLFLFLPPNLITTYLPTFTRLQHALLSEGP